MGQFISQITILVDDYDQAIAFYTHKLGFELLEDTSLSESKRWVVVGPKTAKGCTLLLAKAADERQIAAIGDQTGGRVFLFLYTDDFSGDFARFVSNGVKFVRPPQEFEYGTVAVFEDLYGNLWDLLQPRDRT